MRMAVLPPLPWQTQRCKHSKAVVLQAIPTCRPCLTTAGLKAATILTLPSSGTDSRHTAAGSPSCSCSFAAASCRPVATAGGSPLVHMHPTVSEAPVMQTQRGTAESYEETPPC